MCVTERRPMIEWVEYLECFEYQNSTYCDFSTWFGILVGSIIAIIGIVVAFSFFSYQVKRSTKHEELLTEIRNINKKLDDYKKDHNKIACNVFSNYLYDIRNALKYFALKPEQKESLEKNKTDESIIQSSITAIRKVLDISSSYVEPPELSVNLAAFCDNLENNYLKKGKIELAPMKQLFRLSEELLTKYFNEFFKEKKRLMQEIKNINLEDDTSNSN